MSTSRSYYEILGVNKDDSAWTIRSAYHRLALLYHPDKSRVFSESRSTLESELKSESGPGSQLKSGSGLDPAHIQFTELQRAYSVLSDPKKKRVYDRFGESGLQFLQSGPSSRHLSFALWTELLFYPGRLYTCFAYGSWQLALLLSAVVFIGLKMQFKLTLPWTLTLLPLWLLNASLLVSVWVAFRFLKGLLKAYPDQETLSPAMLSWMSLAMSFKLTCLFVFEAFVALKLDRPWAASWPHVFVPYWIYEATCCLEALFVAIHGPKSPTAAVEDAWSKGYRIYGYFEWTLYKLPVALCLLLKLSRPDSTVPWTIYLLPAYIMFAVYEILLQIDAHRRPMENATPFRVCTGVVTVLYYSFLILLCIRLDGRLALPPWLLLSPILICLASGLLLTGCCLPIFFCCAYRLLQSSHGDSMEQDSPLHRLRAMMTRRPPKSIDWPLTV